MLLFLFTSIGFIFAFACILSMLWFLGIMLLEGEIDWYLLLQVMGLAAGVYFMQDAVDHVRESDADKTNSEACP